MVGWILPLLQDDPFTTTTGDSDRGDGDGESLPVDGGEMARDAREGGFIANAGFESDGEPSLRVGDDDGCGEDERDGGGVWEAGKVFP